MPPRPKTRMPPAQLRALAAGGRSAASASLKAGGYVRKLSSKDLSPCEIVSSGVLSVDVASGCGGYGRGRFVLLYGAESSGKSTLLYCAIAQCQRRGGLVIVVDLERKFHPGWAATFGVDVEALILIVPKTIEEGFKAVEKTAAFVLKEMPDLEVMVGWDSVNAGRGARSVEKGYDGAGFSPEAQAYSADIPLMIQMIDEMHATFIGIAQVRVKVGAGPYESKDKIGVGNNTLHHCSQIVICKKKRIKGEVGVAGQDCDVTFIKNHLASPWGLAKYRLIDGVGTGGIDLLVTAWQACKAVSLVKQAKVDKKAVLVTDLGGEGLFECRNQDAWDAHFADPEQYAKLEASVRSRIGKAMAINEKAMIAGEEEALAAVEAEEEEAASNEEATS